MEFEKAVELLKKAVKDSHLDNQKHIDLTLIDAAQRATYQEALMTVNVAVKKGELTEDELKQKLGLS